jgi:PPOX class probable F420-dependent enzyme
LIEIPESFQPIVAAPGVVVLVTNSASGYPQATGTWFLLDDDGNLKLSLKMTRQKVRNLQRDPRCTLFFLDPANPYHTLEIRADAAVTPDPDKTFAERFCAKYGADLRDFDGPGEERVVVTLHPVKINTFGD